MASTIVTLTTTLSRVIKSLAMSGAKFIAKKFFGKLKGRFSGESELETALVKAI